MGVHTDSEIIFIAVRNKLKLAFSLLLIERILEHSYNTQCTLLL
jgi:hypothetical protein